MKLLSKILKVTFITAICAVLLWGLAYLISPTVKGWTNEHIFHIEQTVEDETPDNEEETPNDGTEDEGSDEIPSQGLPNLEPDPPLATPENTETTEE